jgi:hypothetical protein
MDFVWRLNLLCAMSGSGSAVIAVAAVVFLSALIGCQRGLH